MSKSYVTELVRVYAALVRDMAYAYPALQKELDKSFSRMTRYATQGGIAFFVRDLPALGKHLDKCLSEGEYRPSGLPFGGCFHGVRVPEMFRELYLLVFAVDGRLREDYDLTAIVFLRQVLYMAKKATVECEPKKVTAEKQAFLDLDASLPEPDDVWNRSTASPSELAETYKGFNQSELIRPRWEAESVGYPYARRVFLSHLDIVSGLLSSALGPFSPDEWRHRHGPGVTSNRKPGENKYEFVNWAERLESVFPYARHAFHSYRAWVDSVCEGREVTSDEGASRLIDVPKTFDKPRLIAAEPSENMWCQQVVWQYMKDRVRHSWIGQFIKFDDQTQNQQMCLSASRDGTLATVDLSSASDRVTCHAVGQLFRRNLGLLQALQATRTRFVDVRLTQDGSTQRVALRKFSTMGNACTFPVESLMFLAVAITSVLVARRLAPTLSNVKGLIGQVTIFGDDIIVPVDSRELLERALKVMYFKVNETKTFWTGMFRESCGVDAFAGDVVTPVYWHSPFEETPESVASTVETANNLYKRFYVATSEHLRSTVRGATMPLARMDSAALAWKSFVDPKLPTHLKYRWNAGLQRGEVLSTCISACARKTPLLDATALLQFFTESPQPHILWKSGVAQRPQLRMRLRWVPIDQLTQQV